MPTLHSYSRWSRAVQRHGDSERRQLERGRRWAADNGMRWKEAYTDDGLSGFTGANATKGALGKLLNDVQHGRIPNGDGFWIENLDRLSRLPPWQAIELIQAIVNAGVPLVVNELGDNDEPIMLTRERLIRDDHLLDRVHGELKRAHRESKRKSSMLRQDAARRREEARDGTKPFMGERCKSWVRLRDTKDPETGLWYDPIPEKVAAVNRVYRLATQNIGVNKVADLFEGVEPRLDERQWKGRKGQGRKRDWHGSYVLQLLHDDAVLGWYQPHLWIDGEKVPDGGPIKCYPEIVDPSLVAEARARIRGRRTHGRGRKGNTYANIVTGIGECPLCRQGLQRADPGPAQGQPKLRCYNPKCPNKARFPYPPFETMLFDLSAKTIARLLAAPSRDASAHLQRVASLQLQIEREKKQQARMASLLAGMEGSARAALLAGYIRLGAGIDAAEKELVELRQQIEVERAEPDAEFGERFARAMDRIKSGTAGEERYLARASLNQEYHRIIKRLFLYPDNQIGVAIRYDYIAIDHADKAELNYAGPVLIEFILTVERVIGFRCIPFDDTTLPDPGTLDPLVTLRRSTTEIGKEWWLDSAA